MHDILGHVVVAPGDEDLLAGNAVVVAVGYRPGTDCRQVGTGLRFGQIHRARPLAADELRQIAVLQLVGGVRLDRLHRTSGEQGAKRKAHIGRVPHLHGRCGHQARQPLPTVIGIAAQSVPAVLDKLPVSRAKAFGRHHPFFRQGCAPLVTELVERREHLTGDFCGFFQHRSRQFRVYLLVAGQTGQAFEPRQFVDHKLHVAQRRTIRRHGLAPLTPVFSSRSSRSAATRVERTPYSGYFWRKTFLSSLPTLVLGSTSRKTMRSGTPYFEMTPLAAKSWRCVLISASLTCRPGSTTTTASGRSVHFGSGTPITAASTTPGCFRIRSSKSSDDTHSPPVLITSLMRSVILRYPSSSITAISPVCSQPPAHSVSELTGSFR